MLLQPVAWHKDAAYLEADPGDFFPERGGSSKEGRSYCARCPVTEQCLAYAVENREEYGIGLTPRSEKAGVCGAS